MRRVTLFRIHWGRRTVARIRLLLFDDPRIRRRYIFSLAMIGCGLLMIGALLALAYLDILPAPISWPAFVFCGALILVVGGIVLCFTVMPLERQESRHQRGLCPICAYNLRAHAPGDRCPECGTPISIDRAASQKLDSPI